MKEIHVYVEGGGPTERTRRPLREGMTTFLKDLKASAEGKRIKFKVVMCGGKDDAVEAFQTAIAANTDSSRFHCILVDSDAPVGGSRLDHYRKHSTGRWKGLEEANCHLMVQVMESWFVADAPALRAFYASDFNGNCLPKPVDVENADKDKVLKALKEATRNTRAGEYDKIKHASQLLARIDPAAVRKASRHCDELFRAVENVINQ